ncbi:hypothetical protein [Streptomyces sp. ME19-01-6]|uniref:hypothetical protein n=1 Tax=Streptomyces sp. ME19-01-6 TaxID=3028686 RepID=UPI0029AB874D|nr:hypothetical protein [Streptomyces sp. ME19-01-6]MDX3227033.1 hypothetical protein [Streptomyces sp. ME19-01-6]
MSYSQPPSGPHGQGNGAGPGQHGYDYPQAPRPSSQPGYPPFPPHQSHPQQLAYPPNSASPTPPVPPQAGSSKQKTIGIAVGVLIVVGGIVGGVVLFGGDSDSAERVPDDGKRYKLTAPDNVLGQYKVWGDSAQEQDAVSDEATLLGIGNGKRINNNWSTVDTIDPDSDFDNNKSIVFVGFYGKVDDPGKSVDAYFDIMRRGSRFSELIGSKEKQSPIGFKNGIMKCQYQKSDAEPGQPDTTPVCIWGDHSTVGLVTVVDATKKKLSLKEGARIAADLRNEIRVEIK